MVVDLIIHYALMNDSEGSEWLAITDFKAFQINVVIVECRIAENGLVIKILFGCCRNFLSFGCGHRCCEVGI